MCNDYLHFGGPELRIHAKQYYLYSTLSSVREKKELVTEAIRVAFSVHNLVKRGQFHYI